MRNEKQIKICAKKNRTTKIFTRFDNVSMSTELQGFKEEKIQKWPYNTIFNTSNPNPKQQYIYPKQWIQNESKKFPYSKSPI